jgi:hypothetical protein
MWHNADPTTPEKAGQNPLQGSSICRNSSSLIFSGPVKLKSRNETLDICWITGILTKKKVLQIYLG